MWIVESLQTVTDTQVYRHLTRGQKNNCMLLELEVCLIKLTDVVGCVVGFDFKHATCCTRVKTFKIFVSFIRTSQTGGKVSF